MGLTCSSISLGLKSKSSSWLGPPDMLRKITRLARAGNCGGRGAMGSRSAAKRVSFRSEASATLPMPLPHSRRKERRGGGVFIVGGPPAFFLVGFFFFHQNPAPHH